MTVAYGYFFEEGAEHDCKFVRLLFHYHTAACLTFTEQLVTSVTKYSSVPVQGPQKGLCVISIRNLAKAIKEVDKKRDDINIHRTCDRLHRHSCKLCSFVVHDQAAPTTTTSILKRDPNHVMVVDVRNF